jgi:uncharacterized 2Fe-2S/4Fe-4S cluster protein (DUF4445 family)
VDCIVRFLPDDRSVTVPEGTLISDAAMMADVVGLHLPCGGKGTCRKCMVEIVSPGDNSAAREVPACMTRIISDATIRVSYVAMHQHCIVADSPVDHHKWNAASLSPVCRRYSLRVELPTIDDNYSDLERLGKQVSAHAGPGEISCTVQHLRSLAHAIRERDGHVSSVIYSASGVHHLIELKPSAGKENCFGLACDIGTTTVSLHIVDLFTGRVMCTRSDYNAQLSRGTDIISRINYAEMPERLEELRQLIIGTVNKLIRFSCAEIDISPLSIYSMVVAGNCTMTHMLLGLPPRFIREHPYVPTVNSVPVLSAGELDISISPEAPVICSPGVGSYVGGDITAGLLCTEMIRQSEQIHLFIDIGTNGEIVLGNRDFLMTCACSAGPAFEGSGISCGMRVASGAIDGFTISPDDIAIDYSVIGNTKPEGICGSGLISLLGELLSAGLIDRSGRFTGKAPSSHSRIGGEEGLILVPAEMTAHGRDIAITASDIDNLIRTKAAIFAACDLMLRNIGLDFTSIGKVLIAGGFGKYIDIEQAIRIGLLPDIEISLFSYLGNTSLAGAMLALLNENYRKELQKLPHRVTYVELSNNPGYMDAYMAALFLPHTDLTLFPSTRIYSSQGYFK